jgi:hypothetical protein
VESGGSFSWANFIFCIFGAFEGEGGRRQTERNLGIGFRGQILSFAFFGLGLRYQGLGFWVSLFGFSTIGLGLGNSVVGFSWADFTFCIFEDVLGQGPS